MVMYIANDHLLLDSVFLQSSNHQLRITATNIPVNIVVTFVTSNTIDLIILMCRFKVQNIACLN